MGEFIHGELAYEVGEGHLNCPIQWAREFQAGNTVLVILVLVPSNSLTV